VGAAGLAQLTPRLRPRSGPALRPAPLPVTAALLSAILHGALAAAVLVSAHVWVTAQPKTYVVNLVPAVAAVGSPQGRPSLPPRAEEPPRATRLRPTDLPERETPKAAPPAPTPPPDLPPRAASLPDLPARAPSLPDRAALPRPSASSRAGEKELPPMPSAAAPSPTPPTPAPSVASRAEPPAPTLGRASGSAQGSGALTLNVSDFPFAWYLAIVHRKVTERWDGRALPGRQPVVTFEIARSGQVSNVAIRTSSGNPYYDLTAMRAIADAAPFPALPGEFPGSVLRVHMNFNFTQDRG
jgi:protein TonB